MKRWLLNILAALSLLLCVATTVMWPATYHSVFNRTLEVRPRCYLSLKVYQGEIILLVDEPLVFWPVAAKRPYREWSFLGFFIGSGDKEGIIKGLPPLGTWNYDRIWEAMVPCWAVVLLSAALPLWRLLRKRPRALGLCPKCGYDLRASKERCPECGTPIPMGVVKEPIT